MTISAHRTRLIWSPLVGWALLSCGVPAVHAQSPTQSGADPTAVTPADPSTVAPAVPAGGAAPVIVTSTNADDSFRRDAARRAGTTLPDPTLTAPTVPSAGTTIVNSPFGTSVPYYGGITTIGGIIATGGSGGVLSDGGGITLGAFTLVPQIEINVGFDSNVFAQSASLGPTQSLYTTVSPSLDLRSEWLNHSLHVLASGTIGWYGVAPTQNFQNYGVLVDGKIDIRNDFYATYATGFRRSTEALGTPNVAFAQAPTVVDMLPIEIGLYQQFNRIFYQLSAKAARFWYQDNSAIISTGLPGSSRDRFEYGESFKLGYQLFEDLAVFVAPSFNQIRYIEPISPGEHYRALTAEFGTAYYTRIDASATPEQKAKLEGLSPEAVKEPELAGEPIVAKLTRAPGNDAPIDGLKVIARSGWFAARPSGTEAVYKIYAESFKDEAHLNAIVTEAQAMVNKAVASLAELHWQALDT